MTTLDDLLTQLDAAVAAGDETRARELIRQVKQRLVQEQNALQSAERRVRAVEAALDRPDPLSAPPIAPQVALPKIDRVIDAALPGVFKIERAMGGAGDEIVRQIEGTVFPVWFGTNRKPEGAGFGSARHDRTTYGRAEVFVPVGHRTGEIGTSFWKKLLRFDLRDDTLRLQRTSTLQHAAWLDEVRDTIEAAKTEAGGSHAVVFLHGFNVSFEDAAIRAAQIGIDLAMPGATAFFSWPSRGNVTDYPVDEATIEASEQAITDFLVDFATQCGADKVHVIAHSMGNRGLLRALQRIAANAQTRGQVKFDQIILAAPDVDRDLFLNLAALYAEHGRRTTLYSSSGDLPVHVSAKLHDAARAGYFTPYTVAPNVDTIAVPDFDLDLLGHSYFAQAESLLNHMRDLMLNGKATVSANRLQPASADGATFTMFKR